MFQIYVNRYSIIFNQAQSHEKLLHSTYLEIEFHASDKFFHPFVQTPGRNFQIGMNIL